MPGHVVLTLTRLPAVSTQYTHAEQYSCNLYISTQLVQQVYSYIITNTPMHAPIVT